MSAPTNKVTIAGIDVTAYCLPKSYTQDAFTVEVSRARLMARYDIIDVITLTTGQAVRIWRSYTGSFLNSEIIFDGEIKMFKEDSLIYTLDCFDQLDKANTTVVNTVYRSTGPQAGKFSEIAKDILTTFCGLTADGTTIQDSGTTNILTQYICQNAYALPKIKELERALNWRVFYKPTDQKVYFQPLTFTTNANAINVTNLAGKPVWTEDKSELANAITAIGGEILTQATESFAGPTSQVTLQKKPASTSVTVGGTLKAGGQQNDPGIDYWVDTQNMQVNFIVSSSTIVVTYFFASPIPLKTTNTSSIATYGKSEAVFTIEDATSVTDLEARMKVLLNTYSLPFTLVSCPVKTDANYGYKCGDMVTILDPFTAQTAYLPIQKITRWLFDVKDDIQLGNKEFRLENWLNYNLQSRIKKLEEQNTQNTTIIYNLVQTVHPIHTRRKSMAVTINRINDSFILGHDPNGVLGRGIILDDFEGTIASWTPTNCALTEQLDT